MKGETEEERLARLMRFAALVANRWLVHKHSFTCKNKGHAGNDTDCRMGMPRPLQYFTSE